MKVIVRVLLVTLLLLGTVSTTVLADGVPPPTCFPNDPNCKIIVPPLLK